jgi:hypothetical protein
MTLQLNNINSEYSDFIINAQARKAIQAGLLAMLPVYKPFAQAAWFTVQFNAADLLPARRALLRGEAEAETGAGIGAGAGSKGGGKMKLESTPIKVKMTLTIQAIAEFVSNSPMAANTIIKQTLALSVTNGKLQAAIRSQSAIYGDTALLNVATPFAPVFGAYTAVVVKTPHPSVLPTGNPTRAPSPLPRGPIVLDSSFNYAVSFTLGTVIFFMSVLFVYITCRSSVARFFGYISCCHRRVSPGLDSWEKRAGDTKPPPAPLPPYSVACGDCFFTFYVPRVAPEPLPLPNMERFVAEEESKTASDNVEREVPYRPTYELGLRPAETPALELGLDEGEKKDRTASSVALEAKFMRTQQRKQRMRLVLGPIAQGHFDRAVQSLALSSAAAQAALGHRSRAAAATRPSEEPHLFEHVQF